MSETKPPEQGTQAMVVHWQPESVTEAIELARYFSKSNLMPPKVNTVANLLVAFAAGRDFGWTPMQSLRGMNVVNGKPSMSADAMVGEAKKHPTCEYFRLVESSASIATFEAKRKGDPAPTRMSFTIEEARQAKLVPASADSPWTKYPARMLRNRCKSALCKEVFEEVFFGVYEEDEAREIPTDALGPRERYRDAAPSPAQSPASETVVDAQIVQEPPAATAEARDSTPAPSSSAPSPGVQSEGTVAEKLLERMVRAKDSAELGAVSTDVNEAKERGHITPAERKNLVEAYKTRHGQLAEQAKAAEAAP